MSPRGEGRGDGADAMGSSFHDAANRKAFLDDEAAYCAKFGLDAGQIAAVQSRSVRQMIAAGGNAYDLAKLAGLFGLDMQDIGGAHADGPALAPRGQGCLKPKTRGGRKEFTRSRYSCLKLYICKM